MGFLYRIVNSYHSIDYNLYSGSLILAFSCSRVQVEEKLESGQSKTSFRRFFLRFCTPIFLEVHKLLTISLIGHLTILSLIEMHITFHICNSLADFGDSFGFAVVYFDVSCRVGGSKSDSNNRCKLFRLIVCFVCLASSSWSWLVSNFPVLTPMEVGLIHGFQ